MRQSQVDVVRRNLVTHELVAAVTFEVSVREAMGEVPIDFSKVHVRASVVTCLTCQHTLEECKRDPCRVRRAEGA